MMRSTWIVLFAVLPIAFPSSTTGHENAERGPLAARIQYDHNAIIFAKQDAAAVVRLRQTAPFRVAYDYRFLSTRPEAEESEGTGELFDEPLSGKPSSEWIEVPQLRHQWSYSAEGLGWLYYKPEETKLFFVKVEAFEEIDLSRFVQNRQPRPNQSAE